jgi:hypothetical protein
MLSQPGRPVRGYRPGRYGLDDNEGEDQQVRLANLELYSQRAQAGLPIFDEDQRVLAAVHKLKKV